MIIYLPLLVALIGVLMYGFCKDPKLVEIGRILFWTGVLAFLLEIGSRPVGLLPGRS